MDKTICSKLRNRSLALYRDIADNAENMGLDVREDALKRIAKIERFWPKEKSGG